MENKPLVSVVMPAYNAERFIGTAIESILNQTYTNWELIIVEDGSMDHTYDVLEQYKDDSRIRIIKNEENKGIAYSTNRAIKESKGHFIALHDDDDISVKERLEIEVEYMMEHPEIDILGSGSYMIDRNDKILSLNEPLQKKTGRIKALLLLESVGFRNGTAMIKRSFIIDNDLWYEDNCLGLQDHYFYIKASKVGVISAISNPLYGWRRHGQNESILQILSNSKQRKLLYGQMREKSLQMSGYHIARDDLDLLNKLLPEILEKGFMYSIPDLEALGRIFKDILSQARYKKIDYYDELEWICKKIISECIIKANIFG